MALQLVHDGERPWQIVERASAETTDTGDAAHSCLRGPNSLGVQVSPIAARGTL